jgi:hypothetical protein
MIKRLTVTPGNGQITGEEKAGSVSVIEHEEVFEDDCRLDEYPSDEHRQTDLA